MPIFSGVETAGLDPDFGFSNNMVLAGGIVVLGDSVPGVARSGLHVRLPLRVQVAELRRPSTIRQGRRLVARLFRRTPIVSLEKLFQRRQVTGNNSKAALEMRPDDELSFLDCRHGLAARW